MADADRGALAAHGYPRATTDIDIWVRSDAGNAHAVLRALDRFGAPRSEIPLDIEGIDVRIPSVADLIRDMTGRRRVLNKRKVRGIFDGVAP